MILKSIQLMFLYLAAAPGALAGEAGESVSVKIAVSPSTSTAKTFRYDGQRDCAAAGEDSTLPATAIDSTEIPRIVLQADDPDDRALPCYRIGASTYLLFGNIAHVDGENRGWNGNAGFIVTRDGVIVIDTLGTPRLGRRLLATVQAITELPVRYVIVTHNHPDHAYGVAAFQQLDGVTVIAHAGMLDYAGTETQQRSVDYRRGLLGADMEGFEPVRPDVLIGGERFDRHRIRLGGEIVDVYNAGSHHSHGDLVVHQVNAGILWIADLAFNQRTTYMGDGDSGQMLEAQAWLMQHFPDAGLMVPGHGSAQTRPFPMVAKTRDYVERMREAMRTAVANGVSLLDATQQTEFVDWKDTRLYESNQRANAGFVYREMEAAFFDK
jgi:glyoxylase-like metal-dependent hydrolase (beta-lactamase superfamily II)